MANSPKLLGALLSLSLLAGAGFAQEKVMLVTKAQDGSGGRFVLSDITHVEADLAFAVSQSGKIPKGATALILEEGQPARWSFAPLEQIDRMLGGDGSHEIILFEEASPGSNKEIDLDKVPAKEEVDLFADAPSNLIAPTSGQWTARLVDKDISGCPAMIAGAVAGRAFPKSTTVNVQFTNPFHPSNISADFGRFDWQQQKPNHWRASVIDTGLQEVGGGTPVEVSNNIHVVVQSESTIDYLARIRVKLAPEMAAILGSGTDCRIEIFGQYTRQ